MADASTSTSSALSLREAFGDRKPPDISRKITACVACRKLKIKCHMNDSGPPCVRCKKRGLSCTVNKSLQMILENDVSWKETIEQRLRDLEDTVANLSEGTPIPRNPQTQPLQSILDQPEQNQDGSGDADQIPPETWQVVDSESEPHAAPASYVSMVSSQPSPIQNLSRTKVEGDFITRGLIRPDVADRLFHLYRNRLDHFLYSIIADHSSLRTIRPSSTTLAAAICAVSALHDRSEDYQTCHREFRRRVSTQFFSRQHSLDELRGLCIGAFWLSDMSWALAGAAVRIAIEINLHRCFIEPDFVSREWYTKARVFLLVYICDHHFSVVYGRPPMTRELDINHARTLLNSQYAREDDHLLFSQVEIWGHIYRAYKTFGINNNSTLTDSCLPDFRRLSIALDTWRADWEGKFPNNAYVGNYPTKGVALHYNFAKLYLCSHAFRPFSTAPAVSEATKSGVQEFSVMAINSAMSILRGIVVDEEIQSYLNGLPTYFDTMIAFAVVFLLKLASKDVNSNITGIDKPAVMLLLDQISVVLAKVTETMRPQHLLSGISASVKKLIEKSRTQSNTQQQNQEAPNFSLLPPPVDLTATSGEGMGMQMDDNSISNWMLSPDDSMFIGNFDFMGSAQEMDFNFMDFDAYVRNK